MSRLVSEAKQTVRGALAESAAELGTSDPGFGGNGKIDRRDPVVASGRHVGESTSVLPAVLGMEPAATWERRTGKSRDIDPNGASPLDGAVFAKSTPTPAGRE